MEAAPLAALWGGPIKLLLLLLFAAAAASAAPAAAGAAAASATLSICLSYFCVILNYMTRALIYITLNYSLNFND